MSCQPHRVTSGQSNSGHKQIHISKLLSRLTYISTLCQVFSHYICINPSVKSIYKTNHKSKHYNIHKHQTQIFEELVPSILPLLNEHIRLGHAGIVDHSNLSIPGLEKYKKEMDRHNIKSSFYIYKCIMANSSAIRQQASHTTYQLSSPSCSTRAIQKSLTLNESFFESFWKKVRRTDH